MQNLTSNLAFVAEVYEEDWSEENDPRFNDAEEDDTEYDLSAKSDPIVEDQSEEITQVEEVKQTMTSNKVEEVALMAKSKQIKVESSSSESEKPPNYVPLPESVKEKLCTPECAEQIENYRSYSFRIYDNFKEQYKSDSSSNDNSSDYGFNNPEFIKWQKEMQKKKDIDEAQKQKLKFIISKEIIEKL
ncbi:hypothetical protein QVD17_24567 [Tagetes erecta]|uniref:Uncharacterized protein n=1 Tax=Tagetes erecta TaxID=13708 RepID=A0AAD8KFK6_TARER|nr:hypothetical protein QVD17_24567 [Tagetes erecta]